MKRQRRYALNLFSILISSFSSNLALSSIPPSPPTIVIEIDFFVLAQIGEESRGCAIIQTTTEGIHPRLGEEGRRSFRHKQ